MNRDDKKMIGVVGGIGPYAGIDLVRKILNQTKATCDQDHLPVFMLSVPHSIPDRTEFLLGASEVNPALSISEVICTLYRNGASVIGMPCNTAHAAPIFSEIVSRIPRTVNLIHMINKVGEYIKPVLILYTHIRHERRHRCVPESSNSRRGIFIP
jgi:aspartate racemase